MYLGLGTNLGDRAANLARALHALAALARVEAVSDVYESEPYGFAPQPVFWNMAARVRTSMAPHEFLRELQAAEVRAGRRRTFRMGPRVIDIDVLLWDDLVLDDDVLTIPHPGIAERAFVLRPLLDLDADATHPVTRRRLDDYLSGLAAQRLRRIGTARLVLGDWNG